MNDVPVCNVTRKVVKQPYLLLLLPIFILFSHVSRPITSHRPCVQCN